MILGRSLELEEEVFSHKRDIPILRRMSGGGSVVHVRGNINYSLIFSLKQFPDFFPVRDSYRLILNAIRSSFIKKDIFLHSLGLSDLCLMQKGVYKKVSGNSQARKKGFLMHHGTFLYDLKEAKRIAYYLKMPLKQPEYRENRAHEDFMATVSLGLSKSQIMRLLMEAVKGLFLCQNLHFFFYKKK